MYSLRALWKHRRQTFSGIGSLVYIPVIGSIFWGFYVATSTIFVTSIIVSVITFFLLTYGAALLKIFPFYESDIIRASYRYDLEFSTFVHKSALALRILGYKIDLAEVTIEKENSWQYINLLNIKTGLVEPNLKIACHQTPFLEYKQFNALFVNSMQDLRTFYCKDNSCLYVGVDFSIHPADHVEGNEFKDSVDLLFKSTKIFDKSHFKLNYKALTFLLLKIKLRNSLNGFGIIWLREDQNIEGLIQKALHLEIAPNSLNKLLNFNIPMENWVELKDIPEKWLEKVMTTTS